MATGAVAQSGVDMTASALFRSVWKGSDSLVGAQGRFRVDQYMQRLSTQNWRSLGTLLVQLLRPLENEAEPEGKACWSLNRCLIALAVTVRYMQTANTASLVAASDVQPPALVVNPEFVAKLFSVMVRCAVLTREGDLSTAATMAAAHEVLRTISLVLTAANADSVSVGGSPARFASNAVVDGLLGSTASPNAVDTSLQQPSAKRRRTSDSPSATFSTLQLLTHALEQKTVVSAHKYTIRILRAQSDITNQLLSSSTESTTGEIARWRVLLVCALADRCLDVLDQHQGAGGDSESAVTAGMFACLRDMISLIVVPPSDDDEAQAAPRTRLFATLAKLCLELVAIFRPYVADGTIYIFCAARRHRCYQWAVLCRLSTWATSNNYTSNKSLAEPVAEGGRVCWMHIAYAVVADFESSIWLLLLTESLNYVVLEYPSASRPLESNQRPAIAKPLFTLADESQVKVFTAVALILGRVGRFTDALLVKPNPASQALLPGVVRACARILRLVSPAGASLGLFQPLLEDKKQQIALANVGSGSMDSLYDYVFGLNIPLSSFTASAANASSPPLLQPREDVAPTLLAEQAREATEELTHEATIANVFVAFNSVANAIVIEAEGKSRLGSSTFMTFRTILRWINVYASSARDNVNKQTRLLERDHRDKIRIIGDKARLHKSATDWSRLQSISATRCIGLDVATSSGDDRAEVITYRPAVVQALRTLVALSLQSLLGNEYSQPVLIEQTLAWDSEDKASSGSSKSSDAKPHPALLLCRELKQLLSGDDEEFSGVSLSALQILSSILGVRLYLISRDVTQLYLPHLHVREHSPRSTELLMHLAVQSGLARLMLEPAIVTRFTRHVRDGSMLRSSTMLRAMQMWLDVTGNIVRHSLFRFHLSMFAMSTAVPLATIAGSAEGRASLDFSTWWSLALAASTRCLIDVATIEEETDSRKTRLACIMPSHLLSWQAHLPASDIPAAKLLDLRRYSASSSDISSSTGRAESIRQLLAWLVSFPQPAAIHVSVLYPVYFLSCKLWLDVKVFDRPSCAHELSLRVCRDIWGISTDALLFLSRLVTQPSLRRVFAKLGLVDDFSSDVLTKLISRQSYPDLVSRCLRDRGQVECALSDHEQLLFDDITDLITIPLVEPTNDDKFELEYESDSDQDSPSPPTSSAIDLVGRLLSDISHSRKGGISRPKRPAAEYYSESMLGQLWSQFTKRLLRLPTTIAFSLAASGDARQQLMLARSPTDRRGELSEWLEDSDGVLFDICAPLLTVREGLVYPSTMLNTLASAVSASDIVFTIREAAQQGVSLRTCITATLLLPELYSTAEPLRNDVDAIGVLLLEPLVHGLVGSDENDSQRCLVALLFMAWRQRRRISEQVAMCASQLKSNVVAMKDDLESCEPYLDTVAAAPATERADPVKRGDEANDLVMLSGCIGLLENNQAVTSSVTLLVRHSPILKAMLAGDFAEAQSPAPGIARQVSLQCDHATLAGMLDIFHRCLRTLCASPSRQTMAGAAEGLRAELERDFSHDKLAAIFELASYYSLRPVVEFLAWLFTASFSATKIPTFSAATLDRLTLLHSDNLSGYQASDEFVQAIRRGLAAMLLLSLDQVDPASVVGDAVSSFVSSALFLLYRVQKNS